MSRVIAYTCGTPEEIAEQLAELEAYASRERLQILQRHSDRDPSARAPHREGLAAALAGAVELRADLLVTKLGVVGRDINVGFVLRGLLRVQADLVVADGSRAAPGARAMMQVVLDAERLAQRIRQVPVRRASEPAAAPEQRVNVNATIAAEVEAIRRRRERERLGLPAEPEPYEPSEGSALRPRTPTDTRRRRAVEQNEDDVSEPEPSSLGRAINYIKTDYDAGRRCS